MDHLPSSQSGNRPRIDVPIVSRDAMGAPIYDGGSYMEFPERQGYQTNLQINGFDRMLDIGALSQHSYMTVVRCIQAWLWFGTLHEACSILGLAMDQNIFIRQTESADVLDSSELRNMLQRTTRPQPFSTWLSFLQRRQDDSKLRHLCCFVLAQVQDLEMRWLRPERMETPFPEIMLSIRVLADTLLSLVTDPQQEPQLYESDSFGDLRPSVLPVYRHFLQDKAWCPHQAIYLCTQFRLMTLYYMASMRRRRKVDHSRCMHSKRCVASNISKDFVAKHVVPCTGEGCHPVAALNPEALFQILKNGDIPVIIATKGDNGIELRYAPASPYYGYTAPSHVWSDGLGDPNHNHLPICQLNQLVNRLYQTQKSIAYSNARLINRGSQETIDRFDRRYPKFLEKPLVFWLDAYCIPAFSTDAEATRLKRSAIMQMVPTYGLAQQVLVLDSELSKMPKQASGPDLMAASIISTWRSRYWTHQELTLAGTASVVVQFRQAVRLQRLLEVADKNTDPYGDDPMHQLRKEADRDKSLQRTLTGHICRELGSKLQESKVGAEQMQGKSVGIGRLALATVEYRVRRLMGMPDVGTRLSEQAFFLRMWCSFSGKTSSLPEDMLGILANMLNLDTDELLLLDSGMRLRAILRSYGDLPLNLLLSGPPPSPLGPKSQSSREDSGSGDVAREDRWIPQLPDDREVPLTPLADDLFFSVSPVGLVCSPSVSSHTLLVQQPPDDVWILDGWFIRVEPGNPGKMEGGTRRCFHVSLICEDDGRTSPWSSDQMLIVLPTVNFAVKRTNSNNRIQPSKVWQRGACFTRLACDVDHVWTHWVCAVRYREIHPSSLDNATSQEQVRAGRTMTDSSDLVGRQVGVACSTDTSTWTQIRTKRRPGILSGQVDRVLLLLTGVVFLSPFAMLLLAAGLSTSSSTSTRRSVAPLLISAAFLFLAMLIFVAGQYMYQLANWYIGLASFYEEDESYGFWWRKLHRTLPWSAQRGREGWRYGMFVSQMAIWGLHLIVFGIRVVEALFLSLIPTARRTTTGQGGTDRLEDVVEL